MGTDMAIIQNGSDGIPMVEWTMKKTVLETIVLYPTKRIRCTGYSLSSVKRRSLHLSQC